MRFDVPLDAVLFDMDGTLCHSGSYYLRQVAVDILSRDAAGQDHIDLPIDIRMSTW